MNFDTLKSQYRSCWDNCEIKADWKDRINKTCDKILQNKAKYDVVSNKTSVPWFIIAVIHNMESGLDFSGCLMNGDPWNQVTIHVPSGKGPWNSWEEAAIDAMKYDGLTAVTDWSIEHSLYLLEAYNGQGYLKYHPETKTPYLWSGTNMYTKGLYVADGKYDPNKVSNQVGCVAILKTLKVFNNDSDKLKQLKEKIDECATLIKTLV